MQYNRIFEGCDASTQHSDALDEGRVARPCLRAERRFVRGITARRGNSQLIDGKGLSRYSSLRDEGIDVLGGVFISYRRDDSAGFAGRIYDRVAQRLDPKRVFLDVDSIQPGLDFFDVLSEKLRVCDALIAVIGKNWNSTADKDNRRRLDDPDDFVRIEIEAALERGIRVIPVLIDGATMPRREDLPDSLQKLRRRQAIEISHNRFDSDVERLTHALSLIEGELRERNATEAEAARQVEAESRAREAADAERIAREERERQEAVAKVEDARRTTEVEAARRADEERRAREAAEAKRVARKEREAGAAKARRLSEAEAARPIAAKKQEAAEAARTREVPQKRDAEELKRLINARIDNDKDFRERLTKATEQGPIEAFWNWFTGKK